MLFDENGIMDMILNGNMNYNDNMNMNNNMNYNNNMDMNNIIKDDNDLYSDKIGLLKGNLFKDEYVPYKNFKEKEIIPKNERESLLLKVYETEFAIKDLNLYLDLHPNDKKMFNTFKDYVNKYNSYKSEYEKKYGPLCLETITSNYEWINNPWPWDNMGGTKNV